MINLADRSNPTFCGQVETPGFAGDVEYQGGYPYVADPHHGMHIVDVNNPSSPLVVSSFAVPEAGGIDVDNIYAYVCDGDSGLYIINVSNKGNPTKVCCYSVPGQAMDVYKYDNYVYVVHRSPDGIQVLNCSEPSAPTVITSYGFSSHVSSRSITVAADIFLVGTYWHGLQILRFVP